MGRADFQIFIREANGYVRSCEFFPQNGKIAKLLQCNIRSYASMKSGLLDSCQGIVQREKKKYMSSGYSRQVLFLMVSFVISFLRYRREKIFYITRGKVNLPLEDIPCNETASRMAVVYLVLLKLRFFLFLVFKTIS